MAASVLAQRTDLPVTRPPRASVRWAVAIASCAAAASVFVISSEMEVPAPEVGAALVAWITLSYVACGLIAWSRRPESRFGPLMVAAGFGPLLSRVSELDASLPQTIGEPCRLLPIVLFLHVFLAYPSGRLEGGFERVLVTTGYATAVGFGLAAMMLGLSGHKSLIEVLDRPDAAGIMLGIGRVGTAAVALTGLGALLLRTRSLRRPVRRSLVRASFALTLLVLAAGVVARHFLADQVGRVHADRCGSGPLLGRLSPSQARPLCGG